MVEVAEVLVEGWPLFAEGEGETGVEIVIGGDAVGDDLSFGEEDVAGDLMDHNDLGWGWMGGGLDPPEGMFWRSGGWGYAWLPFH